MWINIFFPFCDVLIKWLIHFFFKRPLLLTNDFLSIINHTIHFIMKSLVYIQVTIKKYKGILITICIWIKGTQRKNIVSSQKWTTIPCIFLSTHQQEKLNVVKGSAFNCFHHMWKLTSHIMATKVSWITSWVPTNAM
jgi:hypothetical protein